MMTSILPLGQIYSAVVQVAPALEGSFQAATTAWNTALEQENTDAAFAAWQMLHATLDRVPKKERPALEDKSGLCLMRFAKADNFSDVLRNSLAMRKELQAQAAKREQKIAEGSILQIDGGKAIGRLAAQTAFGNDDAWNTLFEIAKGSSPIKEVASTIIKLWNDLKPMAEAKDRLEFAQIAENIIQKEYQRVVDDLLKGKPIEEIGRRLSDFVNGVEPMIEEIDREKSGAIPDWKENEEVSRKFHDEIDRKLGLFRGDADNIASIIRHGAKIDMGIVIRNLAISVAHDKELLRVVHSAYLQNLLSALQGIDIQIQVPQGIYLALNEQGLDDLELVLRELIANAIKYSDDSKDKKWIRVRWDAQAKWLEVKDNGIGIKKPKAVWKRGHREARRDKVGGKGMGLKMVRDRLAAMGWRIKLHTKLGFGTTFILIPPEGAFSYE